MQVENTNIQGVQIIKNHHIHDNRGEFEKVFSIRGASLPKIQQVNISKSQKKGTFRGFHLQIEPAEEYKIVHCLKGGFLDIAIDLRKDSPTLLKSFSLHLTENCHQSLVLPPKVAHGFVTTTDDTHILYMHSHIYSKEFETGVRFDDPMLNLSIPHEITTLSERDRGFAFLNNEFQGY